MSALPGSLVSFSIKAIKTRHCVSAKLGSNLYLQQDLTFARLLWDRNQTITKMSNKKIILITGQSWFFFS